MAVTLDGSGGLFTRLGKIGHLLNLINTFRGSQTSGNLPQEFDDILAEYDGASAVAIRSTVKGLLPALGTAQSGLGSTLLALKTAAEATVIEMVHADTPLATKTLAYALAELRTQMLASSDTVDASEPSISFAADAGNYGDGHLVLSVLNGRGARNEWILPEAITLKCNSAAVSGSETFRIAGQAAAPSRLHWQWPSGSGASGSLASSYANGSANKLVSTSGAFDSWATNVPSGWTVAVGTPGTHLAQESSVKYRGDAAAAIVGDGSTLTQIKQVLSGLSAQVPYAICFWARMSAAPGAGVLTIDLYDGSGVIADDEGTNNSFTVDLTTLGTTYVPKYGVFRLPSPLPAEVQLRVRLSTALSSSRTLYLDEMTLKPMTRLYSAGPYAALFGGSTAWELADLLTITAVNAQAGAFQTLFQRLFDTDKLGIPLPSATGAAETIDDALIG